MKRFIGLLAALSACLTLNAQNIFFGTASFDRTVHDFGDVLTSDGPLSCSFTVRNTGSRDFIIRSVVSSCGCTNVKWTTGTLAPGESGVISAVYSNDEGPYPFDKTLSVYIADYKPVILHLRGIVHEKKKPLTETYPVHFGSLGLRSAEIKAGNMSQGESVSGEFIAANIGKSTIKLDFKDVDRDISISPSSISIKAGETVTIDFTIRSNRDRWGRNWYYATPLINGATMCSTGLPETAPKAAGAESLRGDPNPNLAEGCSIIGFWAITKENFSYMTKEQKKQGPAVMFEESSYNFGRARRGDKIKAAFSFTSTGKQEFRIYKIDSESTAVAIPATAGGYAPGSKGTLEFNVETKSLPRGEQLFLLTLYTNSPQRPMVNLFISGFVQ